MTTESEQIAKLPDESSNKKPKGPKRVAAGKRLAEYHIRAKQAIANNTSQNNDNDNLTRSLNNVSL